LDLAFEVFIYIPNLLYIGCEVFTLWFNIFVHSLFWSNKTLTKCYSLWTCKRKHGGDGKKMGKVFSRKYREYSFPFFYIFHFFLCFIAFMLDMIRFSTFKSGKCLGPIVFFSL
jgi:hypothetical protein